MPFDPTTPYFITADVLRLLDLDVERFKTWTRRGNVAADGAHPGPGRSRRFSANDIARVAIAATLADFGMPIGQAVAITQAVGAELERVDSFPRDRFLQIKRPRSALKTLTSNRGPKAEGYTVSQITGHPNAITLNAPFAEWAPADLLDRATPVSSISPVLFVPVGRIVAAVRAQCCALFEGDRGNG